MNLNKLPLPISLPLEMMIGSLVEARLVVNILALLLGLLGTGAMAALAWVSFGAIFSPTDLTPESPEYRVVSLAKIPELEIGSGSLRAELSDFTSTGSQIKSRKMYYHCYVSSSSPSRANRVLIEFRGRPRFSGTIRGIIHGGPFAQKTIERVAPDSKAKYFMREELPQTEEDTESLGYTMMLFILVFGGLSLGLTFVSIAALFERK